MTISTQINKHVYVANGLVRDWNYSFPIVDASEIEVYSTDLSLNTTLITSNYSVDTVNNKVIYPTVASALPLVSANWKITLRRKLPITQDVSLTNQGPLPAKSLEDEYDKLTKITQQLSEELSRSIKFPIYTNPNITDTEAVLSEIENDIATSAASAAAALASENAAATSATNAAVSETNAAQSSQDAIDAINTFVQGFFEKNEVPAGVVDGVNTDFDISLIPLNGVVRVSRNGLKVPEAEYTFNSPTVSFVIPPVRGQIIEASYITNGQVINPVIAGLSFMPEYRTITNAEFIAKQLTLVNTPATASDTIVDVIGGSPQRYGIDFTVSGNVLDWNGLGLDGQLLVGSIVRIEYFY